MALGLRGPSGAGAQPPATWAKGRGRGSVATLARPSAATLASDTTQTQTTAKICRLATQLRQLYSKSKLTRTHPHFYGKKEEFFENGQKSTLCYKID